MSASNTTADNRRANEAASGYAKSLHRDRLPCSFCSVCREEVDRGFAPGATGYDRVTEAGVRQEADHVLSRLRLGTRARQLLLQISRSGVRLAECILFAFSNCKVIVHLGAVSKVEGDGAVDLLSVNV